MAGIDPILLSDYAKKYPAKTVLFREGESGTVMYFVISGSVAITKTINNEEIILSVLKTGDFIGEMAILSDRPVPRSATAVVLEDSMVLVLNEKGALGMFQKSPDMALRMMRRFSDRLRESNRMISILYHKEPMKRVGLWVLYKADLTGKEGEVDINYDMWEMEQRLNIKPDEIQLGVDLLVKKKYIAIEGQIIKVKMRAELNQFLLLGNEADKKNNLNKVKLKDVSQIIKDKATQEEVPDLTKNESEKTQSTEENKAKSDLEPKPLKKAS